MDAIRICAAGVQAATSRFAASAARTATGGTDPAAETIEQRRAKAAFTASLAAVRACDQMLKRLLDVRA